MKKFLILSFVLLSVILVSLFVFWGFFPKKYRLDIDSFAKEYNLSPTLIASVINIESGYDDSSVSKAGAVGLMQLLPDTAYDCAKRMGLEVTYEELFEKSINMRLGCFYLRYLLDLFENNLVNALCAYNWGYGNVCNWIALGNVDSEGTITNIPVKETSNYLKKYNVCSFVYGILYKY